VARGVVALRVSATRPFDTESAGSALATGFVVDARRGIILTNRHVVSPGPVTAEAVFLDHEEVPIHPIYRDPVHDFGFFRYDPAKVRFMQVAEIPLAPEAARVGEEIRLLGNDAGEKLSILGGTLARVDRHAPNYGRGRYNDFNTFYLQAASSSSGGSSGSPVVDRRGRAIGLNAGGRRRSAASFFLPLDRVVRALGLIQARRPVTRGTLEAVFRHEPYDELRRLGLRPETEVRTRHEVPDATGLLVVVETVPGGPGFRVLEPGDVLLRVAGHRITGFVELEALLDDGVGQSIPVEVERGGKPLEFTLPVADLHAVTPSSYLEAGGAVLNALSYQQARSYGLPVGGVYLASRGYSFAGGGIPARAVIKAVDGEPVGTLDAFQRAWAAHADGDELRLRYVRLRNPHSPRLGVIRVDRHWFPSRRCRRDDASGRWHCRPLPAQPPAISPRPATTRLEGSGSKPARVLAHSMVLVSFEVPYAVDGVQGRSFRGAGLVVDARQGLVVVDRDTVPVSLGDVRITFGGSVEVPGRVVALHPEHNLALVAYDPALLGDTPVHSAKLIDRSLESGDDVWLVVMTARQQLVSQETHVARVDAPTLPLPAIPRFREKNLELVTLSEGSSGVGGVLADKKGRVAALWASFSTDARGKPDSFFAGIPIAMLRDMIAPLREGRPLRWRSIGAELESIPLAAARNRGLSRATAARLEEVDPNRRRVLGVRRVEAGGPAAGALRAGDLLLEAAGKPVTRVREVERAAASGPLQLRVLREGVEIPVAYKPRELDGSGTEQAVLWAGALLQRVPRELALQRGSPRSGVYVAGRWGGSPAQRYGLHVTRRITAVDGTATPDLSRFLAAVRGKGDRDSLRLRTVNLDGKPSVLTLQLDLEYWPTGTLEKTRGGWERREGPCTRGIPD